MLINSVALIWLGIELFDYCFIWLLLWVWLWCCLVHSFVCVIDFVWLLWHCAVTCSVLIVCDVGSLFIVTVVCLLVCFGFVCCFTLLMCLLVIDVVCL